MARGDLSEYRRKRKFSGTPEPSGGDGKGGEEARFVVQQHDATRLHWDLRLEHDGVLASWALPRGIPLDPDEDRLAVRTEDHPLEYLEFHGTIPEGQYGAGEMEIWDRGTYRAEKFEPGKVVADFDGDRLRGRYALFRIAKPDERTDSWLIHRMDPPEAGREPFPDSLEPMRAKPGRRLPRNEEEWAFEVLWSGRRALAFDQPGNLVLRDPDGEELQSRLPEVRRAARSLGAVEAILDGVLVAFDREGRPDPDRLAHRLEPASDSTVRRRARSTPVAYVAFDVPFLEGGWLTGAPYEDRRERLAELPLDGEALQAPAHHVGDGRALLAASGDRGLPGVVAKRLGSPYRPGEVSADWREIAAGRG
jgi:bifunctional non-homologous end joining protein LigD